MKKAKKMTKASKKSPLKSGGAAKKAKKSASTTKRVAKVLAAAGVVGVGTAAYLKRNEIKAAVKKVSQRFKKHQKEV